MRSLKKPAMMVGAVTVLTALALSFAAPALADDSTTTPTSDTSASAPAVTTPSPDPSASQSTESAPITTSTDTTSAPADVAPPATEPAPADSATPTDATTQPAAAARVRTDTLPAPPKDTVCSDSGSLKWDKNTNLSEADVTLKDGFTSCDVSLNSYETQGATWETSGDQTFIDHATAHLTKDNPTSKLTVKVQGCFQQQDLYIGTTRYDGKDGALPHYPDSSVPTGLLDHWNGAVDCTPPPLTPKVCTTIATGPKATNLDANGWYQSDTRATGKVTYVAGGVNFQTTDTANPGSSQNKATLYRAITPTPLSEFGEPSVTFADGGSGVKPGMQVGVDVDGNGTWDGYLVGEPWSYGDHMWWVNKPGFNVPSGMGYTSFGSWADYVAANPNAKVIELGFSLGSGVVGNWTVTNYTAGCTSYTFDYVTPTTPVSGTPTITVDGPTCKVPYNTINYNIPAGLSVNGFTGTGSIRAEDYPDARGDGSSIYGHWNVPVVVQSGYTYSGPTSLEFDLVNPASLDCTVPTMHPENVMFHDGCGVTDDSYTVPGTLDDTPSVFNDPVTGDVTTNSSYSSDQGAYIVVDTTTKAGVRTVQVSFVQIGEATIADPGTDDTYVIVTIEGNKYAQWTYTYDSTPCPTNPPTTTPSSNLPPTLAFTGSNPMGAILGALAALIVGMLLINPTRRWLFRVISRAKGRHAVA